MTAQILLAALTSSTMLGEAQAKNPQTKAKPKDPAFAKVTDDPALPRVLLIGDSISIGYTPATRKLLAGKANVHRIPTNGGPTIRGLESLEDWLGPGRWDVIHFNWGLHDLRQAKPDTHQVPIDAYERNLRELVSRLKKTGAILVWATTTPVPEGATGRVPGDEVRYNAAAEKVMKENGITTNDLYSFARPQLDKIQTPANVHFSPQGSEVLAGQVSQAIEEVLRRGKAR